MSNSESFVRNDLDETVEMRSISVDQLLTDGEELLRQHWLEVGKNRDADGFAPDVLRYQAMEKAGSLFILAAYSHGKLAAYSVGLVSSHLHDTNLLQCVSDALFVKPELRNMGLGTQLMNETEKAASALGCDIVVWHAMVGSRLHRYLERAAPYCPQDITFTRRL